MIYPCIIAHRCGGALAPENSLEGLRIAARLGCRGVEFDVMQSADHVPLLMHDDTLERTTTGRGRIADLSAAEIRQFDAGGHHHPAYAVAPAPTFVEAMTLCRELGLWVNIELKPPADDASAENLGRVVGTWLARHWDGYGIVSSFAPAALRSAQLHAGDCNFALLATRLPADWQQQLAATGARALHLSAAHLTDADVSELGTTPWACYTVNQRAEADRLFALGCRAIFTDRPDLWSVQELAA